MFGWFKNKEKIDQTEKQMLDLIDEIRNTTKNITNNSAGAPMRAYPKLPDYQDYKPSEEKAPVVGINDVYTVGVNIEGKTIISLKSNSSTMVLTMGPYEVNRLVRLLLATLDSDDRDFEEKQEEQQEENE